MKQREGTFKAKLRRGFKSVYGAQGVSYYIPPTLHTGVPDLVFIAHERTLWLEAKAGDNQLSKLQQVQRDHIVAAGGLWRLARVTDNGVGVFDAHGLVRAGVYEISCVYDPKFWQAVFGV